MYVCVLTLNHDGHEDGATNTTSTTSAVEGAEATTSALVTTLPSMSADMPSHYCPGDDC